ncbi:MAG: septum formation protein Maf [Pseudomonadota bacterium]|jgi:septum formation protein|nr:septum formation protein Maf [Betaproteobacteria bacterium]
MNTSTSRRLILASSSVYRRELLSRFGLTFESQSPNIDESARANESPRDTALRLAKEKAVVVARDNPLAVVIGSDQVACIGERRLEKPGNAQRALEQLLLQRGQVCDFHTAVSVATHAGAQVISDLVTTHVRFRSADELTEARLNRYIEIEQPFDCAGAAKSEALGITLIESLEGPDPTALIGLPLIALSRLLRDIGFDPLQPLSRVD